MFCPKCSRQQISDNVRFCSRCGFQLSVVRALLGEDGTSLAQNSPAAVPGNSSRTRDMTIGALLMLFFALHTAWVTEDLSLEREYTSLIAKCLLLSALIHIIPKIRDFFRRRRARPDGLSSPKILSGLAAGFKDNSPNPALPHARSRPAADYFTGAVNSAELLAPPPSVTERTTNLLGGGPN